MEKEAKTRYSKINFAKATDESINTVGDLERSLTSEYAMMPKQLQIHGEAGETGLGITFNGMVVGAIKHPDLIPKWIDFDTYTAEFGGEQHYGHIDTSMAIPLGIEYTRLRSSEIINRIKQEGLTAVSKDTGFGTIGVEEESLHFDHLGNPVSLEPDEQVEIQDNAMEVALEPSSSIIEQALQIAQGRIGEAKRNPDHLINSTSFSILSKPHEMRMNNGDLAPYVNAIVIKWFDEFLTPSDLISRKYWDNIAGENSFFDYEDMKQYIGNSSFMAFCASHASLGLRAEQIDGSYCVGLEEAIAVSDLFNSDFSTLLEWMTYSTPLVFGEKIGIDIGDEKKYPKDARAVARLAIRSTYPGTFIGDTEGYKERILRSMINGSADRLDRAGYTAYHEDLDKEIACAHGRVRLRATGGSGKEKFVSPLGRVEFTGGAATPDLIALMSRNAMLKLLGIASYEALAGGESPIDYFADKFPSMSTCDEHIELAHAYNFDGTDNPKVAALIEEGRAFLSYMRNNYKHEDVEYLIDLAEIGINKLVEDTEARTLEQYLENPKGNISDVISNMWEDGYSSLEISHALTDFERKQSEKLIKYGGNVLSLI
ncbi:hypothetical protein GF362_01590 [Candidatus Dojkabacteria bacterium]|nr:hypothetical protein [Candidatus Dojkabacteria bacterium]